MIVRQFLDKQMFVFTYLVGCAESKQAAVIDPAAKAETVLKEADNKGLTVKYIFNTHHHWDHTSGNREMKNLTGADIVMHKADADLYNQEVDIILQDEGTFPIGELQFTIYHTPGHTPGGICLYCRGYLFTGDTLFVGDSGRTDLAHGHRPTLGASIRRLMQLPEDTVVCPGHDYGPYPTSTLEWEKRNNVNAKEYGFYASNA